MKQNADSILHGTAIALPDREGKDHAVFLRGLSGSGKSDLAFRLISRHNARLICDDQVAFSMRGSTIYASSVKNIEGFMEVRGIGLVKQEYISMAPLSLVVDLKPRDQVPRLPERNTTGILGQAIWHLTLHAFDDSTLDKIAVAMKIAYQPDLLIE